MTEDELRYKRMNLQLNCLKVFVFFAFVSLISSSCGSGDGPERLAAINPTYKANVIRFDQQLIEMDTSTITSGMSQLLTDYPAFSDIYFGRVMPMAPLMKPEDLVLDLKRDTGFVALLDKVSSTYPNLTAVLPQLSQALENYAEIFDVPTAQLPSIYTFVSGFAYQSFLFDDDGRDGIGIGTDMFLGDEFPYHTLDPKNTAFSSYITRTFNQEHMAKKAIEVLVEDRLPPPSGSDFLSLIVWGGKKLYVMDRILDFVPDSIITQYTTEQMDWCRDNHSEMWEFFFDSNLFYSTNLSDFSKLIGPAPTSPGMPEASPGSTGNYMGWQIVDAYMNRFPKTTVVDLLKLDNAQQILDDSRYRPG